MLVHQGIWKTKKKIKPYLLVGKTNLKDQLKTNPEELKNLYLNTFKFRFQHRPVQPGVEAVFNQQEELFKLCEA